MQYECPAAFYNCGWSHGREKLQGKLTLAKQAKAAYLKEKAQTATAAGLPAGFCCC